MIDKFHNFYILGISKLYIEPHMELSHGATISIKLMRVTISILGCNFMLIHTNFLAINAVCLIMRCSDSIIRHKVTYKTSKRIKIVESFI